MSETKGRPAGPTDLEKERKTAFEAFRNALLSPAESIEIAEKKEDEIDWEFENEKLSLDNRKEKRDLRRNWNTVLVYLVVTGFFFSYALIILIGFGVMSFDSAFAVPSVVAAGVIETYGLAKLAIKYFFSEDEDVRQKTKRK